MKIITKLYIPDHDTTSVAVPYINNQERVKAIIDSRQKIFEVVYLGMNQRFMIDGITDLIVKGEYTDKTVVRVLFKD